MKYIKNRITILTSAILILLIFTSLIVSYTISSHADATNETSSEQLFNSEGSNTGGADIDSTKLSSDAHNDVSTNLWIPTVDCTKGSGIISTFVSFGRTDKSTVFPHLGITIECNANKDKPIIKAWYSECPTTNNCKHININKQNISQFNVQDSVNLSLGEERDNPGVYMGTIVNTTTGDSVSHEFNTNSKERRNPNIAISHYGENPFPTIKEPFKFFGTTFNGNYAKDIAVSTRSTNDIKCDDKIADLNPFSCSMTTATSGAQTTGNEKIGIYNWSTIYNIDTYITYTGGGSNADNSNAPETQLIHKGRGAYPINIPKGVSGIHILMKVMTTNKEIYSYDVPDVTKNYCFTAKGALGTEKVELDNSTCNP